MKDVLVGEVWLGSGQSNMQFTVSKKVASFAGLINEEQEIADANYPQIRMFTAKGTKSYDPKTDVAGEWQICNPENVPGFSAVGYLFSRDLQKELKVPVGFLTVAYGASTAESWIRRETLAADPLLKPMLDKFDTLENYYQRASGRAGERRARSSADDQRAAGQCDGSAARSGAGSAPADGSV